MDICNVEFIDLLEQVDVELHSGLDIWLMAVLEIPVVGRKPDANPICSHLLDNRLESLPYKARDFLLFK